MWIYQVVLIMPYEVENAMVVDAHWRELEREPKVYGECAGCGDNIIAGQDYYEMEAFNGEFLETSLVHQNDDCCRQYVANTSFCRTAGENE